MRLQYCKPDHLLVGINISPEKQYPLVYNVHSPFYCPEARFVSVPSAHFSCQYKLCFSSVSLPLTEHYLPHLPHLHRNRNLQTAIRNKVSPPVIAPGLAEMVALLYFLTLFSFPGTSPTTGNMSPSTLIYFSWTEQAQMQERAKTAEAPLFSLVLPIYQSTFMVPVQALSKHYRQSKAGSMGEGFYFVREQVECQYLSWIKTTSQANAGHISLTCPNMFCSVRENRDKNCIQVNG